MATVCAVVVIGAIAIVLAVGVIVLFVIAKQIQQCETIVDRHVIDARAGRSTIVIK